MKAIYFINYLIIKILWVYFILCNLYVYSIALIIPTIMSYIQLMTYTSNNETNNINKDCGRLNKEFYSGVQE
jgi:hypothetical protein